MRKIVQNFKFRKQPQLSGNGSCEVVNAKVSEIFLIRKEEEEEEESCYNFKRFDNKPSSVGIVPDREFANNSLWEGKVRKGIVRKGKVKNKAKR